ncbi:uncharacterized protein N7496_000904 [Penicillium cataractarum]|uniref:DUF7702 domain-containing protein n=1 Tax=Penicillium cataractarum TaxID=2100454 RepID=A0A9W9VUX1_9EURO|nr:uncharacterized protein N7496_000904 [Penicillium cataractarum]KAJ5389836.1 hypothetical protein N7496_000904 [Penicillium cataractarum]
MSSDTLSPTETSVSVSKRNIAIAELVIFSLIHIIQLSVRYMQEWKYWHHNKRQSIPRCLFYSWFSMIGLLSQIRIASSAMIISTSNPTESMLIAESSLQSVGLSPLMFEVSLVLLRSGQAGEHGPGNSKYPKSLRIMMHGFRFPVVFAIVLGVVGSIIKMPALGKAGSILLIVVFAFVCGLISWLLVKFRTTLPLAGYRAVLLTSCALPFLLVRVMYFVLLEFGPPKFNPVYGNVAILASMGLLMEIIVVSWLMAARAVAEPISGFMGMKRITSIDEEQPGN